MVKMTHLVGIYKKKKKNRNKRAMMTHLVDECSKPCTSWRDTTGVVNKNVHKSLLRRNGHEQTEQN